MEQTSYTQDECMAALQVLLASSHPRAGNLHGPPHTWKRARRNSNPPETSPQRGHPQTWGLLCRTARVVNTPRPLTLEWPAHLFQGDGVLSGLRHQCGHLSLESLHVPALTGPRMMQDELSHSLALEDAREKKLGRVKRAEI